MCGIAGIFDPEARLDPSRLAPLAEAMSATLVHRGPDGQGVWSDHGAGIAMAQRRLAIVDLSEAGAQPMVSASGRYVIAYNGEFYTHADTRAELEARGHVFRGRSDTETLVEAIDAFGLEEALARLVGMFAIALWDRQTRTLSLVRDRLGIKPLYWAEAGRTVSFGSELKALLATGLLPRDVDRGALGSFLRFGYVPEPEAIFAAARKVRPGAIVEFRAGREPVERTYWSLQDVAARAAAAPFDGTEAEALDRLEALLSDAVACRTIADVPLGAFLSGGVDSSLVAALMRKTSTGPVRTFSIGFADPAYDESAAARQVARHLGTDHTELVVTPAEARAVIPGLAEMYDEPFADSSQIATHLVSRLARDHVTVALSGDGGDEMFAGYNRHVEAQRLARLRTPGIAAAARAAGAVAGAVPVGAWQALFDRLPEARRPRLAGEKMHKLARVAGRDPAAAYRALVSLWPDPDAVLARGTESGSPLANLTASGAGQDAVSHLQVLDATTYLPGDILTKVDRASMAVSLEARVPLVDHRLAAFAFSLPTGMRVRGGRGKWALRQVLARHVPETLFDRPKMGFGVPVDAWLRGPLRDWAEDLLNAGAIERAGFFRPRPIRAAWSEHLSGRRNRQHELWAVLMFEAWRRRWLNAETGASPAPRLATGVETS